MTLLTVVREPEDLVEPAAAWLAADRRGHRRPGRVPVALSGGRTPEPVYRALASAPGIAWAKVAVFFADERAVPPHHAESNYRMVRGGAAVAGADPAGERPPHGGRRPRTGTAAAREYEHRLPPALDLLRARHRGGRAHRVAVSPLARAGRAAPAGAPGGGDEVAGGAHDDHPAGDRGGAPSGGDRDRRGQGRRGGAGAGRAACTDGSCRGSSRGGGRGSWTGRPRRCSPRPRWAHDRARGRRGGHQRAARAGGGGRPRGPDREPGPLPQRGTIPGSDRSSTGSSGNRAPGRSGPASGSPVRSSARTASRLTCPGPSTPAGWRPRSGSSAPGSSTTSSRWATRSRCWGRSTR